MRLVDLVALRPVRCAGVLVTLTQRCPLACAHCSSSSTPTGAEPDAAALLRFVGSFGEAQQSPDVIMLTGGEPLLRPDLVADVAGSARLAGTRSALLTGAFFAPRRRLPSRIRRAVHAVDHFSVSIDRFHERQVARADVFWLLRRVLDDAIPVSVHAVGSGPDDPYLADLVAEVRRTFGTEVPMLVSSLRAVGRAAAWAGAVPVEAVGPQVRPCSMAAWPVVAQDGMVLACCNQDTVDRRPVPDHLRLGHIATDGWSAVRERSLTSPVLRMIRSTGPVHTAARHDGGLPAGHGYCGGCRRLSARPAVIERIHAAASGKVGELLDQTVERMQVEAGPEAFLRRHACAPYAGEVLPSSSADPRFSEAVR